MKTRVALRVTACPCDVRFTPKADTCSALTHVRFVPIADIFAASTYDLCSVWDLCVLQYATTFAEFFCKRL